MSSLDWIIIAFYFVFITGVGLLVSGRGSKSLEDYFVSGRNLPWWLSGISMVATTFAADTPLAVTGIVALNGVAGNWIWWSFAASGLLTVFLYSDLWRKSEILTDAEFAEVRYSGRGAAFLRGFRALYLAIPVNLVIMGWVSVGMAKVAEVAFDWNRWYALSILYAITGVYIIASGLWGVVITDFIQFGLAMAGSILLAYLSVDYFGSLGAMKAAFIQGGHSENLLSANPFNGEIALGVVTAWLFVQWWASWYPGAEPGGGGYIVQRAISVKSSREATLSVLLFNVLHYVVRPWPWILTAIAAIIIFPELDDPEQGYPKIMLKLMPAGLLGLMAVGFMSAFMSTLSTHVNWGASYLVSDIYKRFFVFNKEEKHYILIARLLTLFLLVAAFGVSTVIDSVQGAWKFLIALGAGTGPVYLLRWYWMRINVWSEISAMVAAFACTLILFLWNINDFALMIYITVPVTSAIWITITYLTPLESNAQIEKFRAIIARKTEDELSFSTRLLFWIVSLASIYSLLIGINQILFFSTVKGGFLVFFAIVLLGLIFKKIARKRK